MTDRSGVTMFSRNRWPLLIIFLLVGFFALSAWSFHRAARGASAVTDRDYYSHGLRFDQTRLEQKAAAALGWTPLPKLQGRRVIIELRDSDRGFVEGAIGSLSLLGSSHPQNRTLALRETQPGTYQAELPPELHGEQPAEITFQRDGARLSQRILLSLN